MAEGFRHIGSHWHHWHHWHHWPHGPHLETLGTIGTNGPIGTHWHNWHSWHHWPYLETLGTQWYSYARAHSSALPRLEQRYFLLDAGTFSLTESVSCRTRVVSVLLEPSGRGVRANSGADGATTGCRRGEMRVPRTASIKRLILEPPRLGSVLTVRLFAT